MNTPARFDSLLWMAGPLVAWAQASPAPALPSEAAPQDLASEEPQASGMAATTPV